MDMYLPFVSWLSRYRFGGWDLNIVSTPDWIDYLIKNGIDRKKIVVVSEISMDYIYYRLMQLKGGNNEHLEIRDANKIEILLVTSSMAEHGLWITRMEKELITKVYESIFNQLGNTANLILKIHPIAESLEYYKEILSTI